MPIKVTCEKCGGVLHAPDDAGGKKGRCPTCQNILPIPFEGGRPANFGQGMGGQAPYPPQMGMGQMPPAGFGGAVNPPPGMAFATPGPMTSASPNVDSKRPAMPSFGSPEMGGGGGGRPQPPGLASSTPNLGGQPMFGGAAPTSQVRLPQTSHLAQGGFGAGLQSSIPFGGRAPSASSNIPISADRKGWLTTASGLRLNQLGMWMFVLAILATGAASVYGATAGKGFADKTGLLKWTNFSQLSEIRFAAFFIPAAIGVILMVVGRLRSCATPYVSCARGSTRLSALFAIIAAFGFFAFFAITIFGMKGGFVPTIQPTDDVMRADKPLVDRVVEYSRTTLMPTDDLPGVIQRFGLMAMLIGAKFSEYFFGCSLGRMASSVRHLPAIGGITTGYGLLAILGSLFAFAVLAVDLFGKSSAKNLWGPKWFELPTPTRYSITAGVAFGVVLLLTLIYTYTVGRARRVCIEQGA